MIRRPPRSTLFPLHDALPISKLAVGRKHSDVAKAVRMTERERAVFDLIADGLSNKEIGQRLHLATNTVRSEEHTSELQSQSNLVCRLLLEKKKKHNLHITHH